MTLETFYFIAQIGAALAVVGSLLFVGFQVRQSNAEQRHQRRLERLAIVQTIPTLIVHDAELAEIVSRIEDDLSSLSRAEWVRYAATCSVITRSYEALIEGYATGGFSESELHAFEAQIEGLYPTPGFRKWWTTQDRPSWFLPETQARVNAGMERARDDA